MTSNSIHWHLQSKILRFYNVQGDLGDLQSNYLKEVIKFKMGEAWIYKNLGLFFYLAKDLAEILLSDRILVRAVPYFCKLGVRIQRKKIRRK